MSICIVVAGTIVGWFLPEAITAFTKVSFPTIINIGMAFVGGVVAYGVFV